MLASISGVVKAGRGGFVLLVLAAGVAGCGANAQTPHPQTDDAAITDDALIFLDDGGNPITDDAHRSGLADPNDSHNATKDTDCDGLSDEEEFSLVYADGKKTDPDIADTDGDGLPDGLEVGHTTSVDPTCQFVGDADPVST